MKKLDILKDVFNGETVKDFVNGYLYINTDVFKIFIPHKTPCGVEISYFLDDYTKNTELFKAVKNKIIYNIYGCYILEHHNNVIKINLENPKKYSNPYSTAPYNIRKFTLYDGFWYESMNNFKYRRVQK